jgi:hypothetical protein
MIQKAFLRFISIIFLVLMTLVSFAQPPGGGGGPCDPCNEQDALCYDPDVCVIPINNHAEVLVFFGLVILIGIVFLNSYKKKTCCQ